MGSNSADICDCRPSFNFPCSLGPLSRQERCPCPRRNRCRPAGRAPMISVNPPSHSPSGLCSTKTSLSSARDLSYAVGDAIVLEWCPPAGDPVFDGVMLIVFSPAPIPVPPTFLTDGALKRLHGFRPSASYCSGLDVPRFYSPPCRVRASKVPMSSSSR